MNIGIVALLGLAWFVIGYWSDGATTLTVNADGVEYLSGGRARTYLAWSEIATVVPREFRGWPAEDALVFLDRRNRPLLVATTTMFDDADMPPVHEFIREHVTLAEPIRLSPFTARANGVRHPELVPERTSERFLVSATTGLVVTVIVALLIYGIFER